MHFDNLNNSLTALRKFTFLSYKMQWFFLMKEFLHSIFLQYFDFLNEVDEALEAGKLMKDDLCF